MASVPVDDETIAAAAGEMPRKPPARSAKSGDESDAAQRLDTQIPALGAAAARRCADARRGRLAEARREIIHTVVGASNSAPPAPQFLAVAGAAFLGARRELAVALPLGVTGLGLLGYRAVRLAGGRPTNSISRFGGPPDQSHPRGITAQLGTKAL
jgi:hypothetical protein